MSISVANSRVRLSRDELHQLRWLLGLVLVLLAFWTLFGLDYGGAVWRLLFLLTAASAMMSPGWPGRIPGWIRRWSLIFGAAALFTQFIATQFDIMSGLILLVSLLALSRALEYRRVREDWQLILLCLFIIVLSGVLTLSLLFGLQILIFTVVTMALLFVMNLLQRDAGRALKTEDWKNFHWPRFLRHVRQALDFRQLLQAGGMFVGLVAVSTVIFISIPRYQFDQSFSFSSGRGVAGFHGDIEYHEGQGIDPDESIVLRVDVPEGVHFTTPPYWRMIVLDEYRDNGFHLSGALQKSDFSQSHVVRYAPGAHSLAERLHHPQQQFVPGTWTFDLEGNVSEYLPVLGPFDSLTFSSTQAFAPNDDAKILRTEQPSPKLLGYEIQQMDFGRYTPAAPTELNPTFTANWTLQEADRILADARAAVATAKKPGVRPGAMPHLAYPYTYFGLPADPKDRAMVSQIKDQISAMLPQATDGTAATTVRQDYLTAVIKYLGQNHLPSMNMNVNGAEYKSQDLLVRWLATPHSSGWCEYFAGSFVLLARAAGYPARVVAGYKGASLNTSSSRPYYFVRQSYAHAWAEVYDRNLDLWERWDPTPGADSALADNSTGQANAGITQASGWSAFLDSLRMIWYRRVVNFDQTDQQELAQQVGEYGKTFASTVEQWFKDRWDEIKGWFTGPVTAARYEVLTAALLLAALAWWRRTSLRNAWLRLRGWVTHGRGHRLAPVRVDAGRWLRQFLPVWQSLAPVLPGVERAQWEAVRLDLLALRYGPPEAPINPAGTFQRARALLKRRTLNLRPSTSK